MENLNFGSLNLTAAKPGVKPSSSSTAEVYTAPTVNKFVMNSLASKKMELQHGDPITILVNDKADDIDSMYFLTRGLENNAALLAANNKTAGIGKTLSFNYSGIWSRMIQATPDAAEVSPAALERDGLAQSKELKGKDGETHTSYSATRKVFFEVGDPFNHVISEEEGEEPVTIAVFPLVNSRIESFTPRTMSADTDETEE